MLVLVPTYYEFQLLFGEAVLTQLKSEPLLEYFLDGKKLTLATCGFGLAASGAGTAYRLSEYRSKFSACEQLCLIGIAGSYDSEKVAVGEAIIGTTVSCDGIGIGSSENFQTAAQLGWGQVSSLTGEIKAQDVLGLQGMEPQTSAPGAHILSVAACSGSLNEAQSKRQRHPQALVEDMETFSVALSAKCFGVPLQVIRGISNRAGDRDKANWKVEQALAAARNMLSQICCNS